MRSKTTEPGDLIALVQRLRALLAAYDNARQDLDGSFQHISPALTGLATQLRPQTEATAQMLYEFLVELEKTAQYKDARTRALTEETSL